MTDQTIRSPWARLAFTLLAIMWTSGGWLIVFDGGFTKTFRYGSAPIRVDGPAGLVMAYILMALGVIALAVVLQSLQSRRWLHILAAACVLLPPTLYLMAA